MSEWVGSCLANPREPVAGKRILEAGDKWPTAACGSKGRRWGVDATMWPTHENFQHLSDLVDLESAPALSQRAAAGFLERAMRGSLRFDERFLDDMASHVDSQAAA